MLRSKESAQAPNAKDRKATLGVVAICYNEARDLPAFIKNLEGWVDEIILVDDGSTDGTVGLAHEAGPHVRLLDMPRGEGEYFSHQRNKGIDAAKSDWLLHMDIDERVTPALAEEILAAIESGEFDGYRFRRLNYFMHRAMRGGGWQDWNLIHLARRTVMRFGGMFHESCLIQAPTSRIGQLQNRMLHFNEESFEDRLRKNNIYLEEVVTRVEERSSGVGWVDIVGRTLVEFFRRFILKRGYRDKIPGLIAAMHSATSVFRAEALVWSRRNAIPRSILEAHVEEMWAKDNDDVASR